MEQSRVQHPSLPSQWWQEKMEPAKCKCEGEGDLQSLQKVCAVSAVYYWLFITL
jgi:hypothetical protein